MRRVSIADVEGDPYDESLHADRRDLGAALGATEMALIRFALAPGERFSGAVHAHPDQEEVFVVLEGEATFVTEHEEVVVGADEAVRFAPGEFQSGGNEADDRLVALAVGAPKEAENVLISRILTLEEDVTCPACGRDSLRIAADPDRELICPDCGAERTVEESS